MLRLLTSLAVVTCLAFPALAQQPGSASQTGQTPRPTQPEPTVMVQQPPRPPALPSADRSNVKLDLTITDTYTGVPAKKTVSMLILNGSNGMIRTSNRLPNGSPVGLNIDAAAQVFSGGLITVRVTFEYTPSQSAGDASPSMPRPAELHESLSVILQDGKSLIVSQSADPTTDRKVTVELVATVLK